MKSDHNDDGNHVNDDDNQKVLQHSVSIFMLTKHQITCPIFERMLKSPTYVDTAYFRCTKSPIRKVITTDALSTLCEKCIHCIIHKVYSLYTKYPAAKKCTFSVHEYQCVESPNFGYFAGHVTPLK